MIKLSSNNFNKKRNLGFYNFDIYNYIKSWSCPIEGCVFYEILKFLQRIFNLELAVYFYLGTMDCLKKIIKHEGVLALYNGLEATMMRHITWNAGYFGVIFQVKAQIPEKPELLNNFIAGTIGGYVGTALNTPFDVVKSRIQNTPRSAL